MGEVGTGRLSQRDDGGHADVLIQILYGAWEDDLHERFEIKELLLHLHHELLAAQLTLARRQVR